MYYASNFGSNALHTSFEEEIRARVARGDTQSVLYIVPTGAQSRDLINRITSSMSSQALMLPDILSLGEFISRMRYAVRPELELISASQSAALIELSIRELFHRDELHYFEQRANSGASVPLFQGTFDEIVESVNGLKENGITQEALAELVASSKEDTSERRKLRDITAIYGEYNKKLGNRLIDQYGQYTVLTHALGLPVTPSDVSKIADITKSVYSAFPAVTDIFIAPFVQFAEPVKQLLLALGGIGRLHVTFALDYEPGNQDLFRIQGEFAQLLDDRHYTTIKLTEKEQTECSAFQDHLRRSLFMRRPRAGMFDATKFIQEYKAPSIDDEVRETARRIKELIGSSDTAPDYVSIAVASTDQESYAPVVRSIFSEYGIPFQLTQRTALSATPIFQAFEYLLELGLYRLSRRRVRSVLQSPYFSLAVADPQTLITVLHREHLPQGAADWHSDLRELAEDLDTQLSLEFEDELERRKIERSRDELLGAARDILAIEQLIERLQLGRTPKEFVQQINDLLKELGMLEHILSEANAMLRSGELETETRSYTALMNMLDELLTITDTLGLAQKKLGIGFYLERIRTVATRTRVAGRAEPGSSVLVTSLDQLFGNEYEHLFLLGFRDGLFPLAYRKSLFTPTEHSKTHDAHLIEQRYFFYQTLCTLRGKLFIGWHNGASDGSRIYNRSTALDALRRTVSLSEAKTDERSLFSPNEFYKASAQKINWSSVSEVSSLTEKGESAGMNADTLVRLKNVQPSLIEMEHTRRDKSESVYSGVMQPDELSDEERRWLDAYRDNVYSITQLETYAACGFKYFCKYVLGINANEGEAEDGLDASEQGSILHNALYKLLERFKERGLDIRSMGDSALLASREIMSEIYPESELARMHPFARLDRTRLLESADGGTSVIERFIAAEQESAIRDITTQPRYFELVFGSKSAHARDDYPDPVPPVEIGGVKFRGKIDRIDMDDSGNFVVVDYKSGRAAAPGDIDEGLSLQLPLYLRIAEDILRAHLGDEAIRGVGGLYQLVKAEGKQREFRFILDEAKDNGWVEGTGVKKHFKSREEFEDFIDGIVSFAKNYVEGIAGGKFRLVRSDRRNTSCRNCEYQSVCRVAQAEADGVLPQ